MSRIFATLMSMYVAVDIGGTKTLVAVYRADGTIAEQKKFPTPPDYPQFLIALQETYAGMASHPLKGAVIAVPGLLDRQNGIAIAFGNLAWKNIAIRADIERILGCKVRIENDTKLAALSEAQFLKGRYRKVLYVTISTGISGGMVIDGELDPNTIDAEIGHMLLEHEGRLMRWQEFASGKAIVAKFGKRASEIDDPQDWYIIARNIAIGLIDVVAALTPDVIVLGGGVGTHLPKFEDRLHEEMHIYQHTMVPAPPIIQAKRPEEAVIYGCYYLAKSTYGNPA